jgi:hypothetical protein
MPYKADASAVQLQGVAVQSLLITKPAALLFVVLAVAVAARLVHI